MKKTIVLALLAVFTLGAHAEKKDSVNPNKPVFTVVKKNPITSIKDQNRSGTCWDYSTLSYFESEILKATGKTYDLCESFVANIYKNVSALNSIVIYELQQFIYQHSPDPPFLILGSHNNVFDIII